MTNRKSLELYGTAAFGIESMIDLIQFRADAVYLGYWLDTVPEVYRAEARSACLRVVEAFVGSKLTDDGKIAIVHAMHRAMQRLEPRGAAL